MTELSRRWVLVMLSDLLGPFDVLVSVDPWVLAALSVCVEPWVLADVPVSVDRRGDSVVPVLTERAEGRVGECVAACSEWVSPP